MSRVAIIHHTVHSRSKVTPPMHHLVPPPQPAYPLFPLYKIHDKLHDTVQHPRLMLPPLFISRDLYLPVIWSRMQFAAQYHMYPVGDTDEYLSPANHAALAAC